MGKKKLQQALMIIAVVLLVLGLLKVIFPLILLGLAAYVAYVFLRGPKS